MQINTKGLLPVSHGHEIFYHHIGNSEGPTFLFLHGGPGLGTSENDKAFFDLQKVNLILLDQRGCGKSRPLGAIEHNTTQLLVEDILQLLEQLQIGRVILFGGSWGSTLALVFAVQHPERVSGMILRGIFTASTEERQFFEAGGTRQFFPEIWERFIQQVPIAYRNNCSNYYYIQILGKEEQLSKKLSYELLTYGYALSRIGVTPEEVAEKVGQMDVETKARLLAHYSVNHFFLPEGFIFNQLFQLDEIPVRIVQGRYDMVTTPSIAIALAHQLKQVKLTMVNAGHAPNEPLIKAALQKEVAELVDLLSN